MTDQNGAHGPTPSGGAALGERRRLTIDLRGQADTAPEPARVAPEVSPTERAAAAENLPPDPTARPDVQSPSDRPVDPAVQPPTSRMPQPSTTPAPTPATVDSPAVAPVAAPVPTAAPAQAAPNAGSDSRRGEHASPPRQRSSKKKGRARAARARVVAHRADAALVLLAIITALLVYLALVG